MSIPLQIAEPTGKYQRSLRRFTFSGPNEPCGPRNGHDASVDIEVVTEPVEAQGDLWTHDDTRWPKKCQHCDYVFTEFDEWQLSDKQIYRMPNGFEFVFRHSFGTVAPAGAMIRAEWYDAYSRHPDGVESWLVALPDGGEWFTSQRATDGGYWTVTGVPPKITASPSIFHNAPTGWHGWVRDGELVDA